MHALKAELSTLLEVSPPLEGASVEPLPELSSGLLLQAAIPSASAPATATIFADFLTTLLLMLVPVPAPSPDTAKPTPSTAGDSSGSLHRGDSHDEAAVRSTSVCDLPTAAPLLPELVLPAGPLEPSPTASLSGRGRAGQTTEKADSDGDGVLVYVKGPLMQVTGISAVGGAHTEPDE